MDKIQLIVSKNSVVTHISIVAFGSMVDRSESVVRGLIRYKKELLGRLFIPITISGQGLEVLCGINFDST